MDYDGQRHSFQTLQASKKREESKVARAKEQLEEAKRTFAVFNAELNEEMPALYDSRVLFYLTNLQTLFSAEQVFHSELSKVHLPSPFPPPPPPPPPPLLIRLNYSTSHFDSLRGIESWDETPGSIAIGT